MQAASPVPFNAQVLMADTKFFDSYSRFIPEQGRYETWDESVERVMNMHRRKYAHLMTPELETLIQFAEDAYKEKLTLGSQRALQFGGDQIFKHETKIYNCSFTHASYSRFFQESMYMLLYGCGVGFSVQHQHVAKLPNIDAPAIDKAKVFVVPDSIEGWADAFGVLFSSYIDPRTTSANDVPFPEYNGVTVHFDLSEIRPRGAEISGGFKAPGPDGLEKALEKCRKLMDRRIKQKVKKAEFVSIDNHSVIPPQEDEYEYETLQLRPIDVYDFTMHMSDAVLSGGVRRSATICIFSKTDLEMMTAKTGNWYTDNPQRGRSNNSVALLRDEITRAEWAEIMKSVKDFGEPGFVFLDDLDWGFNPLTKLAA
jgi:ribonucleoside-diphosphate reductase alpha chain